MGLSCCYYQLASISGPSLPLVGRLILCVTVQASIIGQAVYYEALRALNQITFPRVESARSTATEHMMIRQRHVREGSRLNRTEPCHQSSRSALAFLPTYGVLCQLTRILIVTHRTCCYSPILFRPSTLSTSTVQSH